MDKIISLLKTSPFINEKEICGVKQGEKALIINAKGRSIILSADFVEAIKIKKDLQALGKKCEIVSSGREVGVFDDKNLKPFAKAVSMYENNQLDFIIFLPPAIVTKFEVDFFSSPVILEVNSNYVISDLSQKLLEFGYERVGLVSNEGEFAIRGDIFDIFPVGFDKPIRCDFFDDIIEKITIFDQNEMNSISTINKSVIYPIKLPLGKHNVSDLKGNIIVDQVERLKGQLELLLKSYEVMSGFSEENYCKFSELKTDLVFSLNQGFDIGSSAEINYLHNFSELAFDLKSFDLKTQKVILFAGDEMSKNRLKNFLIGQNISFNDLENSSLDIGGIFLSSFYYPNSFSFNCLNIFAIGSDCLTKPKLNLLSKSKKDAFYQPQIGEYVVHDFHGIGKCIKIERLKISDFEKDYFVIEYKNGGILYLPSEQANSLSAYVGEQDPKINVLGGKEFELLKTKVKEKLEGFALELMQAYKKREESKGFKFKKEDFLENAFANSFKFEETFDQSQAIKEVLEDMESEKIMDRLLCGDVGFGKTEVAYRAMFRAVINNKQVAFLCPTTILSQQHYLNAIERMKDFGVKIEVLNRFKKPSETKTILDKLVKGEVDILIGTHKILSKNVIFKDLGLLIIDEEQRFGVADKEKIKAIRNNIDVLALSATPIPRTLHLSLSGIRDISVITTPPKDRLPIQTYVTSEDDEIILSVLKRELSRGGKAFVIYNRVQSIFNVAKRISYMLPEARIGVAHGQMNEKELKSVIEKLFNDQYDIFVSTTLIENGIDLPSANTMVIFDADTLGLGQLYQLRGRIGRSDKLSYAYLLYKPGKSLTLDAYKRLEAIREFKELGSGFKISMRDLEIRGAGNVFGKEQHGHIEKVGYDMYVKLLNETIGELQGKNMKKMKPINIDLPVNAFISEEYIQSNEERISLYVKISEISKREDMLNVIQSLKDAYGDVPNEVVNLAKIALIKNLASCFNVKSIIYDGDIKIVLYKEEEVIDKRLISILSKYGASLRFENLPIIKVPKNGSIIISLDNLISLFEDAQNENY